MDESIFDEEWAEKPSKVLDVSGEICPYPQLYTKRQLEKMRTNEVLEIITDHPPAVERAIPLLCAQNNYHLLVKKKGAVYILRIRKTK